MIDTMSFIDALPSLRSRQWQTVVLVMLDALSVHQLPTLAPVVSNPKLVQKVSNQLYLSLVIIVLLEECIFLCTGDI